MLWHRIFIVDIDGPRKGYSRLGQDVFIFEWAEATSGEVGYNRSSNRYYNDGLSHELVPYVGGGVTNYDYTGGWRRKDLSYQQKMESYRQNCIESGKACAAWIILNGWEIPRDYPWARVNQKPQGFIPVR